MSCTGATLVHVEVVRESFVLENGQQPAYSATRCSYRSRLAGLDLQPLVWQNTWVAACSQAL